MTQKLNSIITAHSKHKDSVPVTSNPKSIDMSLRQLSSKNVKSDSKTDQRNFKLLIDPTLKKGHTKILRYDGILAGVSLSNIQLFFCRMYSS